MIVHRASTALTLLALGLAAAETGSFPDPWVRTAVDRDHDGVADSTAFGPVQLTKTLALDIIRRDLLVEERQRDALIALYQHVTTLGPGGVYHPPQEQRLAYWDAAGAYWAFLFERAGGDVELAVAYWRLGENAAKNRGVESLKARLRAEDPHYLSRFVGAI